MNQRKLPLFSALQAFRKQNPLSFHVPGHKNGNIFVDDARAYYSHILELDVTELEDLDDLHAPSGIIQEAELLAADFFKADHTYFLVNGSTAGNLAMILATVQPGDRVLVQRNSHKSIMHALELSGAIPIFLAPQYDEEVERYTSPSIETVQHALEKYRDVKAVVLTYPDYFGRIYPIKRMIDLIHSYQIPVLVDEAHGVHFSLGEPFPASALTYGADAVVQSAHKTAPAMTQSSYLHVKTDFPFQHKIAYYLQMIQSSSPSYPLMGSLDLARGYLATKTASDIEEIIGSVERVRAILRLGECFHVLPQTEKDDPLKITLQIKKGYHVRSILTLLKAFDIYPELSTESQILFIHGLAPLPALELQRIEKAIKTMNEELKKEEIHATIDISKLFSKSITELALTYQEMNSLTYRTIPLDEGEGQIVAESIIPYPPGIPLILKGERMTATQLQTIQFLLEQGVRIQQRTRGIKVFSNG